MFENGIILTKVFPTKEIIHNQNSRRYKDQQKTKQLEFHWKILKRGNPLNIEDEFESYIYPNNDIGFELNSKTINRLLNSKNIFDFECKLEEFDNLQIFEKTPLSPYLSFIYVDKKWITEFPNFNFENIVKYRGVVKAK